MPRVTGLAAAGALVGGAVIYPPAITGLRRLGMRQVVRSEGPGSHLAKAGTPTSGGLVFCALLLITWLIALRGAPGGVVVVAAVLGALIGGLDDLVKVRSGVGIRVAPKFALLLVASAGLAVLLWATGASLQLVPGAGWLDLGAGGLALAAFALLATSNAVNLNDGVDGLTAGCAVPAFIGLGIAARLEGRDLLADTLWVVAAAVLAFLLYNRPRARVFMGDSGSLAIGLMLGIGAAETGLLILLPLLGAVFLLDTASVILQVGYFRLTHGRRLFRMSPLHHHLELGGIGEWGVDLRFWALAWAAAAVTLLWAVWSGVGSRPL